MHRKNICDGIHFYCNSNFEIFKLKAIKTGDIYSTICSDRYSTVEVFLAFTEWLVLWNFLNELNAKNTSIRRKQSGNLT